MSQRIKRDLIKVLESNDRFDDFSQVVEALKEYF